MLEMFEALIVAFLLDHGICERAKRHLFQELNSGMDRGGVQATGNIGTQLALSLGRKVARNTPKVPTVVEILPGPQ